MLKYTWTKNRIADVNKFQSVDLHTHTNCSDGLLPPEQLLQLARERGVELLAITDHDTLEAYRQMNSPLPTDIRVLVGIELSCEWKRMNVHLVGLNVDSSADSMREAESVQGLARDQRFQKIIARLGKAGLVLDADQILADAGASPGRPHIARYLHQTGQVKSETQAFDRYLGQGKMGDIKEGWPDMKQAIEWIESAGGVAVLAHPLKYRLTRTKLGSLCRDFKEAGGHGIEVLTGQQTAQQTKSLADLAKQFEFYASAGSDFHKLNQPWASLGKVAPLPADLNPVWQLFN